MIEHIERGNLKARASIPDAAYITRTRTHTHARTYASGRVGGWASHNIARPVLIYQGWVGGITTYLLNFIVVIVGKTKNREMSSHVTIN